MPPKRRNVMTFSPYTEYCLSDIAANSTGHADDMLVSYLTLQRLSEEASCRNPNAHLNDSVGIDPFPFESSITMLHNRFETIVNSQPCCLQNNRMGYYHHKETFTDPRIASARLLKLLTSMKIYSIALLPVPDHLIGPQTSNLRLDALSRCVQSTKSVFECILSFPISEYSNFSMLEWGRLIYSITVIFRLCALTPTAPGWEFSPAQQKAQFGVYLESLSFRMGELTKAEENGSAPPDMFCMMKAVLRIVLETYSDMVERLSQVDTPSSDWQSDKSHIMPRCPIFTPQIKETDYWDMLSTSNKTMAFLNDQVVDDSEGLDLLSQFDSWGSWDIGIANNEQFSDFVIPVDQR
jgi:hypothetical protein